MVRKHLKEADRWYYHYDRLGMLVWRDMVSGGAPTTVGNQLQADVARELGRLQ